MFGHRHPPQHSHRRTNSVCVYFLPKTNAWHKVHTNQYIQDQEYIIPSLTSRVFNNGNSQAVRIPQAFRLDTTEVEISRTADGDLLIHPVRGKRVDALLAVLAGSDDEEFIAALEKNVHEQVPMQDRAHL